MAKDYIAANLEAPVLDHLFPNMIEADKSASTWPYFRKQIDHPFRVDRRNPTVGFINRDEASILYGNARAFRGRAGSRSARGAAGRPPISSPPALRRSMSSNLCSRMRNGGGNSSKRSAEPAGARRPFSFPKQVPRRLSVWAKRAPDGHSRSSTATTTGRLRSGTRSLARLISKQPQWSSFMTWCRPMWRRACVR